MTNKLTRLFDCNLHYVFLILAIPATIVFIKIVPPAWGLDEQVHIARAYNISQGHLYPEAIGRKGSYGGALPANLVNVLEQGHTESNSIDRSLPFYDRKDIKEPERDAMLESRPIQLSNADVYDFGPTGPYSPLVYAPASLSMLVSTRLGMSVGSTVEMARLCLATLYIVAGFMALLILKDAKIKWLVFLILLLPNNVFQSSIISADTYTLSVVVLLFAAIYKAFTAKKLLDKPTELILYISMILMAFTKPGYIVLLAPLLFLPNSSLRQSRTRRFILLILVGILFIVTTLMGLRFADSMLVYKDAVSALQISLPGQLVWVLKHPLLFSVILVRTTVDSGLGWNQSIVGLLGYNTVNTPYILTYTITTCFVLASFLASEIRKRTALIFVISGFISILASIVLLYASFNIIGSKQILGVQGRYFTPALFFILAGVPSLLQIKIEAREATIVPLLLGASTLTLYSMVAIYYVSLH